MSNSKRRRCLAPEYSCFPATETKTSSTYTAHFINAKLSAQKSLLKDEPKPITAKPQQNSAAWVAAQPEGPTVPFAPVRCLWPSPPVLDFLASQIDAIEDHNLAPILELFDVQYSSNSNGSAIGQALRARSGMFAWTMHVPCCLCSMPPNFMMAPCAHPFATILSLHLYRDINIWYCQNAPGVSHWAESNVPAFRFISCTARAGLSAIHATPSRA